MTEYIDKEVLRGWTLIPPPTPSGKIIPKSVDDLPCVSPQSAEWIWCYSSKPPEVTPVIILCYDDHGDTPYTYVTVGWRLGNNWIVDNDLFCVEVVAWRELPQELSVKEVRKRLMV